MTTRVLTGTYSSGYALQSPVTTVSLGASGYVKGAGLYTSGNAAGAYTIINDGRVVSSASHDGVYLARGGVIVNGSATDLAAALQGYTAVRVLSAPGTVVNYAAITGLGAHADGVDLADGGSITNGLSTSTTARIEGLIGVYTNLQPATVDNFGTIEGVAAGYYGTGVGLFGGGTIVNGSPTDPQAEIVGYGGAQITRGSGAVFNYGTIASKGGAGEPVAGWFGVSLGEYASLTNGSSTDLSATVSGGVYGALAQGGSASIMNFGTIESTGSTRKGIVLNNGASLTNGSETDHSAIVQGYQGVVVLAGSATVTNFGTIVGSGSAAVRFSNVDDVLVAGAGGTFVGSVVGGGGELFIDGSSGTISGLGESGTLSGSDAMTFSGFSTYTLGTLTSWIATGANTLGESDTLTLDGAFVIRDTFVSDGDLTVDGPISGTGELAIDAGDMTIDAGGSISVAAWALNNGATTLNKSIYYKGTFTLGAGANLGLASGVRLTLSGDAQLAGTVAGSGVVMLDQATIDKMSLGDGANLEDGGSVSQTGDLQIGTVGSIATKVTILKNAAWKLGPYNINSGSSSGNALVDYGSLIKNYGSGTSTISVSVTIYGAMEVLTGGLDLTQALRGTGTMKIDAGALLEIDAPATGGLKVSFNASSGSLALSRPKTFAATINGFAVGDTIDLLRIKATGATINAEDQLVIVNGTSTIATLALSGNYSGATLSVTGDGNGGADITLLAATETIPGEMTSALTRQAFVSAMASSFHGKSGEFAASNHSVEFSHPPLISPRSPGG